VNVPQNPSEKGNVSDLAVIRPLTKTDNLDDLIALSRTFFAEYEAHHADFFQIDRLENEDVRRYFSRWLDDENGESFIALAGERIVGYITIYVRPQASFWQVKQVGEISGLMVHPAYRRQGIAGQLLARAKGFFAEKGVRYFAVYTSVENRGALAFYERRGLQPLYTTLLGEVGSNSSAANQMERIGEA
jgi:ribosomal protein S18 acetylase RimI-like enzyme